MRWNEIITEITRDDIGGFWITETGERINLDRNMGINHVDIVLDRFKKELIDSDPDLVKYLEGPGFEIEDVEDVDELYKVAYNDGWIRISTFGLEMDITFQKLNRNSLNSLRKHIKNNLAISTYILLFDHDMEEFDSLKSLFRKLNEIFHGNIINESVEWDLAGFWITETGERIDVDHNKGTHHANIALDHFIDYLDFSDFSEPIDPYNDEYIADMALEAAFNEGWVRVSTSPREIDVTFWKLNRNSLLSLRNHLKDEQLVPAYVLDHVAEFDSLKSLFRKLNEIFYSQQGIVVPS